MEPLCLALMHSLKHMAHSKTKGPVAFAGDDIMRHAKVMADLVCYDPGVGIGTDTVSLPGA